ncbi:MAG: DUF4397 domain-containing protein [Gammaproteobacteria bacterium]|nr:DUF4397 domain-containing protein [Gammaproteobacteria bacterium]
MNQKSVLLAIASLLITTACGSGSGLPEPTGKANFRAINAIERSPPVAFRIEELTVANVPFQEASATSSYDDFSYRFNFDVVFAGDNAATRIASRSIDTQANQDYTLLLGGTIASPTVTVWETAARTFDVGATVFQARFGHTASSVGAVDYYLAAAGVAPVLGSEVASSLSFGEITAAADFETGDYVLTITTAGDPVDVLYTSDPVTILSQRALIITPFDGDAGDPAPIVVRALGSLSASFGMPDSSIQSTVEFLHGSPDLGNSDIYDDEGLTNLVVQNHDYQQTSAAIPLATGDQTFRYVPVTAPGGGTPAVSLEAEITAVAGVRYRITASGLSGAYTTPVTVPDRRPLDTAGKLGVFHTSNNFEFLDYFLVARDEVLDAQAAFRTGIQTNMTVDTALIPPGSYDLYIREFGQSEVLAGPIELNLDIGDVYELLAFDTTDPSILNAQLNELQ